MIGSASVFVEQREAVIRRLEALARADARIAALWLQGSLADGTADALSDVDAYLAIDDAAFGEVWEKRRGMLDQVGTALIAVDSLIPGLKALHCVLAGPVKLDLFFETVSSAPAAERPAVRVLVDKAGLGPQLKTGWRPSDQAAIQRAAGLHSGIRQGATWPIRLLLRGQWSTFAMMELELINDNLATMMAVQVDPQLLYKNRLSMPRLLPAHYREDLDALTQDMLDALAKRDLAALQAVHLRVVDALVRESRAAFARYGLPYPLTEQADAELRALYEQHWPAELPVPSQRVG